MANERQQNKDVLEPSRSSIENVQRMDEAHPSTPPTTIQNPLSPSFFEVSYLISS